MKERRDSNLKIVLSLSESEQAGDHLEIHAIDLELARSCRDLRWMCIDQMQAEHHEHVEAMTSACLTGYLVDTHCVDYFSSESDLEYW